MAVGPELLNDERRLAHVLNREPVGHCFADRDLAEVELRGTDGDLGKRGLVSDLGTTISQASQAVRFRLFLNALALSAELQSANDERPLPDVLDREPVRHRFVVRNLAEVEFLGIDLDLRKGRLVCDLGTSPFLLFDIRLLLYSPLAILAIVGNLLELYLLNRPRLLLFRPEPLLAQRGQLRSHRPTARPRAPKHRTEGQQPAIGGMSNSPSKTHLFRGMPH